MDVKICCFYFVYSANFDEFILFLKAESLSGNIL